MDRDRLHAFEDGDEATPQERALEALLARLPQRACPGRVRANVLAALRADAASDPAAAPPAPAEVKSVARWSRRRLSVILEVAALLAIAVIGINVYQKEFSTPPVSVMPPEGAGRETPGPAEPTREENGRTAVRMLPAATPSSRPAEAAAPEQWGFPLANQPEQPVLQAGENRPAQVTRGPRGGQSGDQTADEGFTAAAPPAPAGRPQPTPSPTPAPSLVRLSNGSQPAAPEGAGKGREIQEQPAVAFVSAPDRPPTPAQHLKDEEKGKQADHALEAVRELPPQGHYAWFEIESTARVRQDLLARNTIQTVSMPSAESLAQNAVSTWTAFAQTAVASFNTLVNDFGGSVTHSSDVILEPRQRPAVMIECLVPASNYAPLVQAVDQKRLAAVATSTTLAAGAAFGLPVDGRRGGFGGYMPPVSNVRRVPAFEIANSGADFSNFYVQQIAPDRLDRSRRDLYSKAFDDFDADTGGESRTSVTQLKRISGAQLRYNVSNGIVSTATEQARSSALFGRLAANGTAGASTETARLVFILEPDALPAPAAAPSKP